jgi:LysM repeat protein
MFTRFKKTPIKQFGKKLFAVLMVLAFLGASLPAGAVLAADDDCQETYTVKSGDWLTKIAANYDGVLWSDIAEANNIEGPSYTIFVGQKLCIPKKGSTGSGSTGGSSGSSGDTGTGATITFSIRSNNRIRITVDNAQARAFYFVKLDDTKQSRYEWYKVGTLRTDSGRDGEATFTLPDDLARATGFNICLKNTATDDLLCNNSSLTRLADRSDDDDDDDDKDAKFRGTFTVTRQSGRITIETDNFPKDHIYNVRVAEITPRAPVYTVIGKLRTEDETSDTYRYDLTRTLNDADRLRVCLKDTETDLVSCQDVD